MTRSWSAAALAAGTLLLASGAATATADVTPPPPAYGSGTLTTQNILDLISQMTVPEEVAMVHGEGDPPLNDNPNATTGTPPQPVCNPVTDRNCVGEAG